MKKNLARISIVCLILSLSGVAQAQDVLQNPFKTRVGTLGWNIRWSQMCAFSGYHDRLFQAWKKIREVATAEEKRQFDEGYDGYSTVGLAHGCEEFKIEETLAAANAFISLRVLANSPTPEKKEEFIPIIEEKTHDYYDSFLYSDIAVGQHLENKDPEEVIQFLENRKYIAPQKIGKTSEYFKEITKISIVNNFLKKNIPRVMYGSYPLDSDYRYYSYNTSLKNAVYFSKDSCERHFAKANFVLETKVRCRIIAYNNTFFFGPEVYVKKYYPSWLSANMRDEIKKLLPEEDEDICFFAINPEPLGWSNEPDKKKYVDLARYRGLDPETCKELAQKSSKKNIVPLSSDSTKEKRSIAVQWEGKDSLLAGHVTIPKLGAGDITFSMPGTGGKCSGTFVYTETTKGIWSAACTSGETASGSFKALGAGNGSTGTGKDNKGNTVRFTIGAR